MKVFMIRITEEKDLPQLKEIHDKYYKNEFPFPFDLGQPDRHILDKFLITDDDNNIITFGALEIVAEMIAITNKKFPAKIRREAVHNLFQCILFAAAGHNFDIIHCTANDNKWMSHLKKVGWKESNGQHHLFYKVVK